MSSLILTQKLLHRNESEWENKFVYHDIKLRERIGDTCFDINIVMGSLFLPPPTHTHTHLTSTQG